MKDILPGPFSRGDLKNELAGSRRCVLWDDVSSLTFFSCDTVSSNVCGFRLEGIWKCRRCFLVLVLLVVLLLPLDWESESIYLWIVFGICFWSSLFWRCRSDALTLVTVENWERVLIISCSAGDDNRVVRAPTTMQSPTRRNITAAETRLSWKFVIISLQGQQ